MPTGYSGIEKDLEPTEINLAHGGTSVEGDWNFGQLRGSSLSSP